MASEPSHAPTSLATWRQRPYRLLFPLGLALAVVAIYPWLAFSRGRWAGWPAGEHALLMIEGFLAALAAGFLATFLPRRTGAAPPGTATLALLALAPLAAAVALWRGRADLAQVAFLVLIVTLVAYAVRALRRPGRPPLPDSFLLAPTGLAMGAAGALLLATASEPRLVFLARQLVQQGFMLGLVCGIAPFLAEVMATGRATPPAGPRARALWIVVAVLLVASFPLEAYGPARAGLGLRALACTLALARGPFLPDERRGFHRGVFRVAMVAIMLGLWGGAITPDRRVALAHLTYAAGFALIALAVSVHVVLLHEGRDALADRSPWPVVVATTLMVAAGLLRVAGEQAPMDYITLLGVASALWLAGVLIWAGFLAWGLSPARRALR